VLAVPLKGRFHVGKKGESRKKNLGVERRIPIINRKEKVTKKGP